MSFTVGIDLGYEEHQVCVVDSDGTTVDSFTVAHKGRNIDDAIGRILEHADGDPSALQAGLEKPHGAFVDALLGHGLSVHAINPKQLDRFRDRYYPSGAKDDRRDAFVLANALRTDPQSFRTVNSQDPVVVRLRGLAHLHNELVEDFGRQLNRLRSLLHRYYPQILELGSNPDQPWLWDLLEAAPTPEAAEKLSTAELERILSRHRIRRLTAEDVRSTLQQQPVQTPEATVEAAAEHVRSLLPRLRLLDDQRKKTKKKLKAALDEFRNPAKEEDEHRDLDILLSVPGLGTLTAATMLAEAPELLQARDYHTLRIRAGVAPVTRSSGKRRMVCMRQACNQRLRDACRNWALASLGHDAWAKRYYHDQRARGHSQARALRALGDRWLAVVTAMLRDGTLYDPSQRRHAHETANAA